MSKAQQAKLKGTYVLNTVKALRGVRERAEQELPPEYRLGDDDRERRVVDHIAGMTDRYALRIADEMSLLDNRTKQPPLFID